MKEGQAPFDALRTCSAAHLGVAGRADTVARIALAQDFEREASASVVRDPLVLSRIAQAYLLALDELRTSETYDLNLPFLTANERGRAHFRRTPGGAPPRRARHPRAEPRRTAITSRGRPPPPPRRRRAGGPSEPADSIPLARPPTNGPATYEWREGLRNAIPSAIRPSFASLRVCVLAREFLGAHCG